MTRGWWECWSEWAPMTGFPFARRPRFFDSGEVRLAILSLLSEGPKHGYQLMKELEDRSGGMYRASAGTVYPTLQLLEDEGLIEAERENGRKVYRITEAGRQELGRDPAAVRRIWERAGHWEDWGQCMGPKVFSLAGPVAAVMKAAFRAAARAADNSEREERVRKVLDHARKELEELERTWR